MKKVILIAGGGLVAYLLYKSMASAPSSPSLMATYVGPSPTGNVLQEMGAYKSRRSNLLQAMGSLG